METTAGTSTADLSEVATSGELAADVAAAIDELRVAARAAADASRAESTERAYAADWRDFSAFANRVARGRLPAEPETVALYVADLARRGPQSGHDCPEARGDRGVPSIGGLSCSSGQRLVQ